MRFKPDIAFYNENILEAFIEYESTNSSDTRFFNMDATTSDLRCIKYFGSEGNNLLPKYWIVIFTLPKRSVDKKSWKSWESRKSDKRFMQLIESPFNFYFPRYIKESKQLFKTSKIYTDLYLLNIDQGMVTLEEKITGA